MKKLAKVLACVLAIAMLAGLACAADSQDVKVSGGVAEGGSFVLTIDTTGVFTTDETEYARGWFQSYGDAFTVTKVTITYDGAEVDVTDYATIDGTDGDYTLYITPETDKVTEEVVQEGYFADASTLDKVTAISYHITLGAPADAEGAWWGGAIGTNNTTKGWNSFGQWTSAEDDRGSKEFILVAAEEADPTDAPSDPTDEPAPTQAPSDDTPKTGDATSIVALAVIAIAAMGGVVVSSKKRA